MLSLIHILYYIITEYYLSLENQDEAVKYFDKVLQSRGLTGYADRQGATLTLEKVIQERRKELICEGQYFLDVYKRQASKNIFHFI